ncbi:hypothetical protein DVH24_003345 [Malus domestica]|uniref:Uncharacterized protein n=1 Tax=Malus domestica TaxID=3750 RepID=A0A498ILA5_MALDO|nr:hypothetical protein DVH24_003345 [Malus domestica]
MARARCLGVSSTIMATAILLCKGSDGLVFSCMTFVGGLSSELWKQCSDSLKTLNAMARQR